MTSPLLALTRPKISSPALPLAGLDEPKDLKPTAPNVEPVQPEPATQARSQATVSEQAALRTRHTQNTASQYRQMQVKGEWAQSEYYTKGFEKNPDARINKSVSHWQNKADNAGEGVFDGESPAWAAAKYTGYTVLKGLLTFSGLQSFENDIGEVAHSNVKRATVIKSGGAEDPKVRAAMLKSKLQTRGSAVLSAGEFALGFTGAGKASSLAKDGVTTIARQAPSANFRGLRVAEDQAQEILKKGMQPGSVRNGVPNKKYSLDEHVLDFPHDSNWISTSAKKGVASNSLFVGMEGFVFKIRAQGGTNVADFFKKAEKSNKHSGETETAFNRMLKSRELEGVWPVSQMNGDVKFGEFISNPKFDPVKKWMIQWGRNPK